MTNSLTRIGLTALGSLAVIGSLIGAKALAVGATPGVQPAPRAPSGTQPIPRATSGGSATPASHAPSSKPSPSATSQSAGGTFTGDPASARYGDVQVQIDVTSGHIDDIRVVQYPNSNRRDVAINQRAIPVLIAGSLAAQSANIDVVSGATYTSRGYQKSLQSAIDKAGI